MENAWRNSSCLPGHQEANQREEEALGDVFQLISEKEGMACPIQAVQRILDMGDGGLNIRIGRKKKKKIK